MTEEKLKATRWMAYFVAAVALAATTGLQANDGDILAATIAGLGTATSLLSMANTKVSLRRRTPVDGVESSK